MAKELPTNKEQEVREVNWTHDPEDDRWYATTNLGQEGPQYCFRQGEAPSFYAMSGGYGLLRGYMYSDGTGRGWSEEEPLNKFKYGLVQVPVDDRINPALLRRKHSFQRTMSDLGRAGGANWDDRYQAELDDNFLHTFERNMSSLHGGFFPKTMQNMGVMLDGLRVAIESFPEEIHNIQITDQSVR